MVAHENGDGKKWERKRKTVQEVGRKKQGEESVREERTIAEQTNVLKMHFSRKDILGERGILA